MKRIVLICLLFLVSCASQKAAENREPAQTGGVGSFKNNSIGNSIDPSVLDGFYLEDIYKRGYKVKAEVTQELGYKIPQNQGYVTISQYCKFKLNSTNPVDRIFKKGRAFYFDRQDILENMYTSKKDYEMHLLAQNDKTLSMLICSTYDLSLAQLMSYTAKSLAAKSGLKISIVPNDDLEEAQVADDVNQNY